MQVKLEAKRSLTSIGHPMKFWRRPIASAMAIAQLALFQGKGRERERRENTNDGKEGFQEDENCKTWDEGHGDDMTI